MSLIDELPRSTVLGAAAALVPVFVAWQFGAQGMAVRFGLFPRTIDGGLDVMPTFAGTAAIILGIAGLVRAFRITGNMDREITAGIVVVGIGVLHWVDVLWS